MVSFPTWPSFPTPIPLPHPIAEEKICQSLGKYLYKFRPGITWFQRDSGVKFAIFFLTNISSREYNKPHQVGKILNINMEMGRNKKKHIYIFLGGLINPNLWTYYRWSVKVFWALNFKEHRSILDICEALISDIKKNRKFTSTVPLRP